MEHFTPVSAAIGGALIGLSAALLWLSLGRIAGISGIVGNLASARSAELDWRIAFLAGLIAAPVLYRVLGGSVSSIDIDVAWPIVIVGGVLVGVGTRLGSGCTSGHGVCGMARFSRRSILATTIFMGTAMVTTFVSRHLIGI
jgi:uncharacterized protein